MGLYANRPPQRELGEAAEAVTAGREGRLGLHPHDRPGICFAFSQSGQVRQFSKMGISLALITGRKNRAPFHTSLALSQPYLLESAGARMNPKCGLNSSPPPSQDTSCRGGVRCGRRGEVDEALGRDANHGESRGHMLPLSCLGSGRGCLPMSPSWRCKDCRLRAQLAVTREPQGGGGSLAAAYRSVSRSSSQGCGRGERPGAKCPELRGGSRSLTQKQQLELAARVLLVPAKLPLDLGADALRLLLLRGHAAAAGHGTRSPRQATESRAPGRSAGRSATAAEFGGKRPGPARVSE